MKRHLCNTSDSLEIQKLFKLDISVTGSNFFDVTGNEKFSFFSPIFVVFISFLKFMYWCVPKIFPCIGSKLVTSFRKVHFLV